MSFKAVIFDLDGTLLNTLEDIADAANIVLRRMGYPLHEYEQYKYLVGEGMDVLMRRALPSDVSDDTLVSECVSAMRKEYGARWHVKTQPYPGVPELLDELTVLGIALAVLSNKPDDFTKTMVADLLPARHFAIVQGATASAPKKPDPSTALEIARLLTLAEQEILFVGDSAIDMQTGLRAGMYPAGVLWGFRDAEELIASGAQVLIKEPAELLKLLDETIQDSKYSRE